MSELTPSNWIALLGYLITIILFLFTLWRGKKEINEYQIRQDQIKRKEEVRKIIVRYNLWWMDYLNDSLKDDLIASSQQKDKEPLKNGAQFLHELRTILNLNLSKDDYKIVNEKISEKISSPHLENLDWDEYDKEWKEMEEFFEDLIDFIKDAKFI